MRRHIARWGAVSLFALLSASVLPAQFRGATAPVSAATIGGHLAAPILQATLAATPTATVAPTAKPVVPAAMVAVSPTLTSPGSLVVISGTNFQAGEVVALGITRGTTGTVATAGTSVIADVKGSFTGVGVTIPYTETAGAHRLLAIGQTSKRLASAALSVAALNPRITLSNSVVKPGQLLTVQGSGFAPVEPIVLALNSAALATTAVSVTTTQGGSFTAVITVPETLLQGLNTISALGERSRSATSANLTGTVPLNTSWYFAGGNNLPPNETYIDLLNPGSTPALVTLDFYFEHGGSTKAIRKIAPGAQLRVRLSVAAHGLVDRRIFTAIRADRRIFAQETVYRPGQDSRSSVPVAAPATTWYLAEGYTGLTFRTEVDLFNPGDTTAHAQLQLLPFNGRAARTVSVVVPSRGGVAVSLNRYMPNQSLAAIVSSDVGIVAERTMNFGANGYGATDKAGVLSPSTVWMFAEGSTARDYETFFTILNPSAVSIASVTASFFDERGTPLGNKTIFIEPLHRGNIKLNDVFPGRAVRVATILSSNVAIVAERPLYLGPPNAAPSATNVGRSTPGSDVFGRNGGSVRWIFAGGNTANGDQEYLLLFNPNLRPSAVSAVFYTPQGKQIQQTYEVPPMSRLTISVNSIAGLPAGSHGIILSTTNGQAFVAEQTIRGAGDRSVSATQGIAE